VIALASIRDLSVRYTSDGAEVTALKGIRLDVVAGERLAIIGESGSGKSTLALAIAGLLPRSAKVEGRIDWFISASSHSFAPPSVLPDISPTKGEIGSFGDRADLATSKIGEGRDES
jgi:peptide/nickel transport system ATP-binding protein